MDSSTPLTSRRPTDFRVCYDDDTGIIDPLDSTARRPWGVAPIDFNYAIHTDVASESLTDMEKDAILTSVSAAIIESVYEYGCFPRQSRKRRRQTAVSSASISRRAEILSISPGSGHEWLGDCAGLTSGSHCSEIRGTVEIAFDRKVHPESTSTGAVDFESVGNTVLFRIQEDMINGNYVDKVNNDMRSFGRVISTMKYIDSDYPDLAAKDAFGALDWSTADSELSAASAGGMTRFSKAAIPIMVILSLLAMGLCWCAYKSFPMEYFFAKRRRSKDEKARKEKRKHESKHALSLEATLEDLEEVETRKYGDRSFSRFSPVVMGTRAQSAPNIGNGAFQPSDTETGTFADETAIFSSNEKRNATPIRLLSSLFGNSNTTTVPLSPEPTITEKISACTGIPCTGNPNNQNQNNGAVMRYITPSVVRSNSLIDEEELPPENISRSLTMPSPSRSWFPRMGSKKAAAYKEYINEKMNQRNPELANPEPMKIGVKRTFTDSQGQIREMVAL